jgi:hypothetical protein
LRFHGVRKRVFAAHHGAFGQHKRLCGNVAATRVIRLHVRLEKPAVNKTKKIFRLLLDFLGLGKGEEEADVARHAIGNKMEVIARFVFGRLSECDCHHLVAAQKESTR